MGSGRYFYYCVWYGLWIFVVLGVCFWWLVFFGFVVWFYFIFVNLWMSWGEVIWCSIFNCSYIFFIVDFFIFLVIYVNYFENIYMCVCVSVREEMYFIIGVCMRRMKFYFIFWVRKGLINRNCNMLNNLKMYWRIFWICYVL